MGAPESDMPWEVRLRKLQGSLKGALKGVLKHVPRLFQGNFQGCVKFSSSEFQGCLKISLCVQWTFNCVSMVFQGSFLGIS